MKRTALFLMLALAGCEQRQWTRTEIEDIARAATDDAAEPTAARIEELESKVADLERQLDTTRKLAIVTSEFAEGTSDLVSQNARAANENALRDMTRRGACGYEMYQLEPTPGGVQPGVVSRAIPCTMKDLKP